jgi:signal transduction histidine kinase
MTESVQAGPRPADPRRRWAIDVAIAVVVTAVQLGATHASSSWWHPSHGAAGSAPGWSGYLLLMAAGLVLTFRRRFPVAVLTVSLGATLLAGAIGHAGMIWIALIAAFFNAVVAGKRLAAVASLVIGYAASFWPVWRIGQPGHASLAVVLGIAAWLLVLLAVAELVRFRRDHVAELARNRAEQLRRQAGEERMRIARDLHDVVAHNISVINVQANTALHLMDRQPERAREALTAIHDVSRQALTELRSVLGVLRSDEDLAPRAPSPGLGQLDDLLAAVRRAGLEPRLRQRGDRRQLPVSVDLAAYRIVQEALTNSARHSTSGTADVLVSYEADGVLVQVDDSGPARSAVAGQAGNGITGMTERALALGGRLSAGRRPDGGFRVAAWLPSPASPAAVEVPDASRAPTLVEPVAPVQPPAAAELPAPVEVPDPGRAPAPVEPAALVELPAPVQPRAAAELPAPVQPPALVQSPAPVQPPAAAELPAPVEPPAGVKPPSEVEPPAPVQPPTAVEPAAPVEPTGPVQPPAAGQARAAGGTA